MPVRWSTAAIMADMRRRIANGEWPPGHQLLKPSELARDLYGGVSAATVRRATDNLKLLGVLEGHQGVAVFVAEMPRAEDGPAAVD